MTQVNRGRANDIFKSFHIGGEIDVVEVQF